MSSTHGKILHEKVLEIGPIPPPQAGWGVRTAYVLEALRQRGIETAALDLGPNRKVRRAHCDDVQSAWDYARKVFRYVRSGYRVHAHLNGDSIKAYLLVLYSASLSWLFGRRAVLTWHGGLRYRYFPDNGNRIYWLVHWMIFRFCECIICNDDLVKERILEYGVPAEKVIPIQAFSVQYMDHRHVALPEPLCRFLDDHSPRFFSYVYFRPEFYLPVLVESLKRLVEHYPNLGLVLVGFKEGSQATVAQLRAAGLEEHTYLAGDLERDEFLTLLGQSDLCIRTAERDGISSSVLEALALGVPVVAARNPLRPAGVVTYEAADCSSLVQAVRDVIDARQTDQHHELPAVPDTVAQEVDILVGAHSPLVSPSLSGNSQDSWAQSASR